MGGPVAIETAANILRRQSGKDNAQRDRRTEESEIVVRGVATIASMKEVSADSPQMLLNANVELLLIHNVNEQCKGANSKHIAKLAGGGIAPLLFPGENHGVKSAFRHLSPWLPSLD
jgi:hypothetical protein